MRAKVWRHFLGGVDGSYRTKITDALEKAGIHTYDFDARSTRGPGVLFFTEINDQLRSFLHTASSSGKERILAVARSQGAVSGRSAWRLLEDGAADVIAWDRSKDPAAEVAARFERWEAVDELLSSPAVQNTIIGRSPSVHRVLRLVVEVARFTQASVLITGESGTGKELVARLIHELDGRPLKADFVVVDCTTIVPELSGSEFFGHQRGAFTGAVAEREGAFELADGGTLFLDEVGELGLGLQAELLRVIQERTYKRVGSNTWKKVDFRLVCATNRDILEEQARGQFRRDLYHRIATWTCWLPPLRERVQDILPLTHFFLERLEPARGPFDLDDAVRDFLLTREYPGNVRELKHLVYRISQRHVGPGPITVGDIPEDVRPSISSDRLDWRPDALEAPVRRALSMGVGLKEIRQAATEAAIQVALDDEGGNVKRAAKKLGVTDRALQLRRARRANRQTN